MVNPRPYDRQRAGCRALPPHARTAAALALLGLVALSAADPTLAATGRVPVAEVHAGQTGWGLTVLAGAEPDTFTVTVLGVQRGARTGGDIILVELAGHDFDLAAVSRGMSGSPVYLDDGRLLGAIAFGWPGALRPICGLTPAGELHQVRDRPIQTTATTTPSARFDRERSLDPAALLAAGSRPTDLATRLFAATFADERPLTAAPAVAGAANDAWPTPTDLARRLLPRPDRSVAREATTGAAADQLVPLELAVYALPAGESLAGTDPGAAAAHAAPTTLAPGSACAIALVSGDAHLGALGTVSLIEGDRVVLMGHPFMQLGPIDLPLAGASVVTVFPSRELSFKMGSAGPPLGRITHDLRAGLAGVLGEQAPSVPVTVTVDLPTGSRTFEFQVAVQAELTPALVFWCLYNALLAEGDDRSRQLVSYDIELTLAGRDGRALPPVNLEGVAGGPGGVNGLQSDWQAPLQILLGNRHEPLSLQGVRARLGVERPVRTARVVALHAPARIAPNEAFTVEVELEPRHGDRWREQFTLQAPAGLRPGPLRLGAASARDFFQLDGLRASGLFEDHSLAATLDLLNWPRAQDELTVVLIAPELGFTAAGRELPRLPPSVRYTLASGPPGSARPTLAAYLLRDSRPLGVLLQGDAVRDIEVRLPPAPRPEGVRP